MLIPIKSLEKNWAVNPKGVLHIGAHKAEESIMYQKFGWGHVTWVEAQPQLVEELRNKLNPIENTILQAACWGTSGVEFEFNVASNGHSSSLLAFGTHTGNYPKISYVQKFKVVTRRLDEVLNQNHKFNFVAIDVQGAELEVLKGLGDKISEVNWIYTEVNKEEVYLECAKIDQIDEYLKKLEFKRVATRWVLGKGRGDALYVRQGLKQNKTFSCRLEDFLWNCREVLRVTVRFIFKH